MPNIEQELRRSTEPEEQVIDQTIEALNQLQANVSSLKEKLEEHKTQMNDDSRRLAREVEETKGSDEDEARATKALEEGTREANRDRRKIAA